KTLDSQVYTSILAQAAKQLGAKILILPNSSNGKSIIGRLAVKLNAGTVTGVKSVPTFDGNKMTVSKSVFSGKATATFEVNSDIKILSVMNNSIPLEMNGSNAPVEAIQVEIPASKIKVLSVNKIEGKVPLPEASVVVSAGRGMKGPENWGIIEDLADAMGATTACSRPVADSHWRPHYEHVGQTGVAIRPNLYIAIGISGAIQHLAGVNNSKTIVVINKDSEAPFFKAADYGVCADLFEVVPKLTEAIKKFKNH
ncbi:MAG: electron transfer flavoprotein subunit alpha/FixB family protein, partial [Saprospiraceae bacterium]|nr:electron transfer flavoprotein subunit alpha/FixB family protein [Saprospiraceae bacterium]